MSLLQISPLAYFTFVNSTFCYAVIKEKWAQYLIRDIAQHFICHPKISSLYSDPSAAIGIIPDTFAAGYISKAIPRTTENKNAPTMSGVRYFAGAGDY